MKKLVSRIKNKYDSAARWKSVNPVLLEGEFGIDEYGRVKAGDGTTAWNSLPYVMESFRLDPVRSSESGGTVSISPLSDQVVYVYVEGDAVLNFEKVYLDGEIDRLYYVQKRIYLENVSGSDVALSVQNAEWANDVLEPEWGKPGMHLYILATWIGGRIILEMLDNDQLADNMVV